MRPARRWPKRVATAAAIALSAVALLAWATVVPYREFDTMAYHAQHRLVPVARESSFDPLIRRAQIDYWITPTPFSGRCTLIYTGAARTADELHLVFWAPVASNNRVIYAFGEQTRRPQWKTEIGTDD